MAQQRGSGGSGSSGGRKAVGGKGSASGRSNAPGARPSAEHEDDLSPKALVELIGQRMIDQLGVVILTKERIEETVGDAVSRGRVTTDDAQALVTSLLERGRRQTSDLLGDIEQVLDKSRQELEDGAKLARRKGEDAARLARRQVDDAKARARKQGNAGVVKTEKPRKAATGGAELPIDDYDELTAAQVKSRLDGLTPAELRRVREYERRHANRKSALKAIETQLS